jgi:3-hydroxyisobutyrate dehydrogenase-like beta-hydroxyacid dehydrogenase
VAKLGFIGLGIMGDPMARHLLQAGHEVALWSYTAGKADQLLQYGKGTVCASPAEVASRSDYVFLCVGDTDMSRQVILGESGLISSGRPGLVVVDCSTISPNVSVAIASKLKQHNIDFLDAPCTGSKNGSENGTLTFMVGGREEVFEKVKPYFLAMGNQLYYCGHSGMGLHAKLSQNLIIGNLMNTFNESFVLSTKAGVAPELMLEILNNSAARSGLVAAKAPQVFARDFSTHFSVKWLEKDMDLMLESAAALNVPTPLTALSRQMLRAAIAKGYGEQDICASIQVLEEFARVEVKASATQEKLVG